MVHADINHLGSIDVGSYRIIPFYIRKLKNEIMTNFLSILDVWERLIDLNVPSRIAWVFDTVKYPFKNVQKLEGHFHNKTSFQWVSRDNS